MFKHAMPKTQTSNCKRFNALELPDNKADRSNKLQVILWINAVDSENRPACLPIIASLELTKPTGHVLWLENLKQDESMKHQCDRNLHISTENVWWFESQEIPLFQLKTSGNDKILMIRSQGQPGQAENWLGESRTGRTYTFQIGQLFW
jgi:hypothetical protein